MLVGERVDCLITRLFLKKSFSQQSTRLPAALPRFQCRSSNLSLIFLIVFQEANIPLFLLQSLASTLVRAVEQRFCVMRGGGRKERGVCTEVFEDLSKIFVLQNLCNTSGFT